MDSSPDIDLQQKLLNLSVLCSRGVDFVQQLHRIDGVNAFRQFNRLFRLVRLKMSDQMPDDVRRSVRNFGFELLNPVFSEFKLPRFMRFENIGDRKGF